MYDMCININNITDNLNKNFILKIKINDINKLIRNNNSYLILETD